MQISKSHGSGGEVHETFVLEKSFSEFLFHHSKMYWEVAVKTSVLPTDLTAEVWVVCSVKRSKQVHKAVLGNVPSRNAHLDRLRSSWTDRCVFHIMIWDQN